ncbi:MAG: NFACT family protein [Candidatus Micrarchaeota archaeon]|nr:NFACT family protein [Candidatus Micrarchaeota archaeon]
MRELCQLEIIALVRELDAATRGFFIDKFYEMGRGRFRIRLTKSGEKINLQCLLPYAIGITDYIEASDEASNFAIAVRKRISNFVVQSVEQLNNDRIIQIKAGKGDETVNIIFEMFGFGNMVITDKESKILLAHEQHDFKDREVRVRATYKPPANATKAIIDEGEIEDLIKSMVDKSAVAAAKSMNIGAQYSEEAVSRSGLSGGRLDKDSASSLSITAFSVVEESLNGGKAYVYLKEGVPVDFSLCNLVRYATLECKEFPSLQSALSFFYLNPNSEDEGPSAEAQKILKSIEKQRRLLDEIQDGADESRKTADAILHNMTAINILINAAKSNKRVTKEELQSMTSEFRVIEVNLKEKTMRLEKK